MKSNHDQQEFEEFVKGAPVVPHPSAKLDLSSTVHRDLNPSPYVVFSKLLAIHFATAVLTLSICPQFGIRLLGDGMGLMHYFMSFGTYGCLVACGAFFTGTSVLAAGLLLRGEELRKIRQNRWLELGTLVLLSLGFFVMKDAELIFGITLAWTLGALLGSLAVLELTWMLRFNRQMA